MKKSSPRTKTARNPGPVGRVRKFNETQRGRSPSAGKRAGGPRSSRPAFERTKPNSDGRFSKFRSPSRETAPSDEGDASHSVVDQILRAARFAAKGSLRTAHGEEPTMEPPASKTTGRAGAKATQGRAGTKATKSRTGEKPAKRGAKPTERGAKSTERPAKKSTRTTLKSTKRPGAGVKKTATASPEGDRLQKVLALAGCGSRRTCEEFIQTGRVMVDNEVVTELGTRVRPDQTIHLDGELVKRPKNLVYFALNKPRNVLCTNDDPAGRRRALDFIHERATGLFPVGRLDQNSEGLLLITNDGELGYRLTHPSYEVAKVYHVRVSGTPTRDEIAKMNRGLYFEEGLMKTEDVRIRHTYKDGTTLLEITLREGQNREIRRILARIGHNVLDLVRVSVGSVKLGKLPLGEYRSLTSKEVRELKKLVGML